MNDIKKYLEENGAYLHHIGMLVEDNDAAMSRLSKLPGFGEWESDESNWPKENMIVGPPNSIRCSKTKIFDTILLEMVQPIKGKATGTHFETFLREHGEGPHHICYALPTRDMFHQALDYMVEQGCIDVHHGILHNDEGKLFVEFCYVRVPDCDLYIELNWTEV